MSVKPLAVVTGGTSGIGLACAQALQSEYRLALIYLSNHAQAKLAIDQLAPQGGSHEVRAYALDVAQEEQVKCGCRQIEADFFAVPEVIVHAAGVAPKRPFFVQVKDLELHHQVMQVNYFGYLRVIQHWLAAMQARGSGSLLAISSISALGGYKGVIGYAESKAALECFSKNLAQEVGPRGLRVGCVRPGLVATAMTEDFLRHQGDAHVLSPVEVAAALADWLRAGRWWNGSVLQMEVF
jgi:NAD(P)-dependent dehydrogenase (short-subunit alcohol dehydrogenase family)